MESDVIVGVVLALFLATLAGPSLAQPAVGRPDSTSELGPISTQLLNRGLSSRLCFIIGI